jgi:hypothetical protein
MIIGLVVTVKAVTYTLAGQAVVAQGVVDIRGVEIPVIVKGSALFYPSGDITIHVSEVKQLPFEAEGGEPK